MTRYAVSLVLCVAVLSPSPLAAQGSAADTSRPRGPRRGAEFGIPLVSVVVPGFGQYMKGSWPAGAGFTGTAAAGYTLILTGSAYDAAARDLPRTPAGQRAFVGVALVQAAGELSAYDAFHQALPSLRQAGKYDFMTAHEPTERLLLAPFDFSMLKRWTTWVNLAFTGATTVALVLIETEPGAQYAPFRVHDGAFVASFSYNAAVGEEAFFRGWLYPVLYQNLGRRDWLANGLQAGSFGALHAPRAGAFALVIAGSALYDGWLTRRNGWSVRESVFNHFWYDVAVGTASLLTQKSASITVAMPVRF